MLVFIMISMVRSMVRPLRASKPLQAPQRILLFAFMGLGDAIMMLPMLRLIKAAFPHASITALTTLPSPAHEILTLSGCVEEILFFNFKQASARERWAINASLEKRKFDAVLCSYIAPLPYFVRAVAGIPVRIGHTFPQQSWQNPSFGILFSHPVALHPDDHRHETERYRLLGVELVQHFLSGKLSGKLSSAENISMTASALDELCYGDITHAAILLHPHESSVEDARRVLRAWNIPFDERNGTPDEKSGDDSGNARDAALCPIIGIHPAVGATQPWRQWGIERFVAVAHRLMVEHHASILLFGSDADAPLLLSMQQKLLSLLHSSDTTSTSDTTFTPPISSQLQARVHIVTPSTTSLPTSTDQTSQPTRLPLEVTMGFLCHCHVLLANDGGIAHLANACGVPTVRIFGMTDYHGYRTLDKDTHTDLWLGLPCSPCMGLGVIKRTNNTLNLTTCGHRNCLRLIEEDTVLKAVQNKLSGKFSHTLNSIPNGNLSSHQQAVL
jgi:ADP-heptose:LPS heptosyltransferase